MELVLAWNKLRHYLLDLEVAVADCTFLFALNVDISDWDSDHCLNCLFWESFAHATDLFLELKEFFVSHLVWVNIVLIFGLEPH